MGEDPEVYGIITREKMRGFWNFVLDRLAR